MTNGDLQGWHVDPFGLHEFRYFSAGNPTKLVRDRGIDTYDEPPSDAWDPALATAAPASRAPGPGGGQAASVFEDAVGFPATSRRRGRGLVTAAVVVALVAAAGGVALVRSGHGPGRHPSVSTVAFVTEAARRTLAERTADIGISGTIHAGGQSAAMSGSGEINFSTNAMSLELSEHVQTQSVVEKEILVRGNLYLSEVIDGKSFSQLTGGRHWVQMPARQSATANLGGTDPLSSLSLLEQHGDSVQSLGTKVIAGVTCSGYSVTPSRQAMIAAARKVAAGLPPNLAALGMALMQGMSPPVITVWFDGQEMLREMSVDIQMSLGSTASVSASVVMTFSHYGAPVVITSPAKSDTLPYASFIKDLSRGLSSSLF